MRASALSANEVWPECSPDPAPETLAGSEPGDRQRVRLATKLAAPTKATVVARGSRLGAALANVVLAQPLALSHQGRGAFDQLERWFGGSAEGVPD